MELALSQVRRSNETHSHSYSSGRSSPDLDVDLVSQQVINSTELRRDPLPNLHGRVSMLQDFEENLGLEEIDTVGRYTLGMSREEAEHEADRVQERGGYVLIPEDREFRKEDCLAGEKAPLWISAKVSGIGQSVEMMKEVKDKDKKPDSDEERQAEFDEKFALFKFKLGLTKGDVVNYNINGHSIMIYDKEGNLKGKYDLLEDGLNEDPQNPVRDGGGLKQLLRDRGYIYSDAQPKSKSLPEN